MVYIYDVPWNIRPKVLSKASIVLKPIYIRPALMGAKGQKLDWTLSSCLMIRGNQKWWDCAI